MWYWLGFLLGVLPVHAQTHVFDGTEIRGEILRPDGSLVSALPALEHTGNRHLDRARVLVERATRLRTRSYLQLDGAYEARRLRDADTQERKERAHRRLAEAARRDEEEAVRELERIEASASLELRTRALALRAHLLDSLGRAEDALADARTLLSICATCPEAADAHLRLGEHAFLEADLPAAVAAYDRVIAMRNAPAMVRAFACFKRGWARLNLGDLARAYTDFDTARRQAAALGDEGRTLARESARDQVRVLASLHVEADEASRRILAIGADDAVREALARRYEQALRDSGMEREADAFARAWALRP